jgi:hypothetical protein
VGTTKEQRPSTGAKVRGALPGEAWREYVSPGAEKAYDGPLSAQREEAHKLARKGRLVAAHKREKAAYKIRVRGYDRKRRGEDPLEKAYTSHVFTAGPVKYASRKLRMRKLTPGEQRAEQMKVILGGAGSVKLLAGAGAGALATDAFKDAQDKSKKVSVAVKSKIKKPEETKVTKSLANLDHRVTMGTIILDAPQRIEKADSLPLVEIQKGPLSWIKQGAKKLVSRPVNAITDPLKKKAKKYALYGAAGAAGTVAAGTAVGNTVSPRR